MIDRFLDRACAVIGAIICIQIPVFMQQYYQRLAGHYHELELQVNLMQKAALETGKNLTTWISKAISSGDPDFVKQGEILQGMVTRFEEFSQSMTAWQNASVWERPFVFLRHVNREIAESTYQTFQYGLSFTVEGAIYALIGLILGFSLYIGVTRAFFAFCKFIFQKEPKKEPVRPSDSIVATTSVKQS